MRTLRRKIRSKAKISRSLMRTLIGTVVRWGARILSATWRFEFDDTINFRDLTAKGGFMLTMWHSRIAMVEAFLRRYGSRSGTYTLVVSNSVDGDLICALADAYPQAKVVRVPKRDRHLTLRHMIRSLGNNEVLMVVADGSRGPAEIVKKGVPFTARAASSKVVPVSFFPNRYWRLGSWDRMIIPKPFAKIRCSAGSPISLPPEEDDSQQKDIAQLTEAIKKADVEAGAPLVGVAD